MQKTNVEISPYVRRSCLRNCPPKDEETGLSRCYVRDCEDTLTETKIEGKV